MHYSTRPMLIIPASIHGYDYKFVQAPAFKDRYNTWVKVEEIYRTLQQGYRFVIFVDSDVIFNNLKVPMEPLIDHWNITSEIAIAAAAAPAEPGKYDIHGSINLNTGFLIIQDTAVTMPMMEDWIACPQDTLYPNCSHWKNEYYHEQSAFSNFIRHDDRYKAHVREIACDEANGAPEHKLKGPARCTGRFVRHYWVDKHHIKAAAEEAIAKVLLPGVRDGLSRQWNQSFVDHSNFPTLGVGSEGQS